MCKYQKFKELSPGYKLFIATIRSAIREDYDFILKGESLEILADMCGVDSYICQAVRHRVEKWKI
uniref:Uncharacterized protein n=1 Tax=viral metagenome TaxID=1070528 RepID=A0A6M3KJA8_9ZZZZ